MASLYTHLPTITIVLHLISTDCMIVIGHWSSEHVHLAISWPSYQLDSAANFPCD